jgi:hypothetical protein
MAPKKTHAFHRYLAYHNYVHALARLVGQLYPTDADLIRTMASLRGFQVFKQSTSADLEDVAVALRHSWYTELMMRRTTDCDSMFPYAIGWSMVHAYYAIHRAMHGYFMVSTNRQPTHHTSMLHVMSNDLRAGDGRFPYPWCTTLDGDPKPIEVMLTHSPMDGPVIISNPMTSHYNPWQNIGLLLRTTRMRQLDEMIEVWKRQNRTNRLPSGKRNELAAKLMPTTLFDALYRMRRRSNYQDTDSYIFSHASPADTLALHNALVSFAAASLLVFECLIAHATPFGWMDDTVIEFIEAVGTPARETIGRRWAAAQDILY